VAIKDDLDGVWGEKGEREAVFTARAILESLTISVQSELPQVQEIEASNILNDAPPQIRNTIKKWMKLFEDVQAAAESDADIVEILNWRP